MKFLANENFPGDAVAVLRAAGNDVAWVRVDSPGASDNDVLARAVSEARILLTFDKDFGELAWHSRLPASCGIVLFRIPMPQASAVGELFNNLLSSRQDWAGHFSVIEPSRVRMRPLPE